MPWTCSTCGRTFTRNKQAHSCEKHSLESLFIDKPQHIWELYQVLMTRIREIGPLEEHPSKWNITLRAKTTFMSIFPEKKDLALTFVRDEPLDDFPVYNSYQHSKNMWSNHVKIEDETEIDQQLLTWIKDAYQLCS